MKKYRLTWQDVTEYETFIEASSEEEAKRMFDEGELKYLQPTGNVEYVPDTLLIEEEKE